VTRRELAQGLARLAFAFAVLVGLAAIGGLASVSVWSGSFAHGFSLVCSMIAIGFFVAGLIAFFQTGGYRVGGARFSSPREWEARSVDERRTKEVQAAGLIASGVLFFLLALAVG
jgi:hypothetical protein